MSRWTVAVECEPGEREEIDVTARSATAARRAAEDALREGYEDGWRVASVRPFAVNALVWGGDAS